MSSTILIIAEEEHMRWVFFRALSSVGYDVRAGATEEESLPMIEEKMPQLILLDLDAYQWDGFIFLQRLQQMTPQVPIVVVSHQSALEKTLQALKLGARDYIHKPFDLQELRVTVEKALHMEALQDEVRYLRQQIGRGYGEIDLVGQSRAMQSISQLVEQVANSMAPVLLQGERGTGKETVARALHYKSKRREKPLIIFDCSAVPAKMAEGELFGWEAEDHSRQGALLLAQGGTLFLKEITSLSLPLQARLVEVLNRRFFRPAKSQKEKVVDIRFIASTTLNMGQLVRAGRFREDLYYHLKIIPVFLPPLRQRVEDISPLAHHFLKRFDPTGRIHGFTAAAMSALEAYPWPGHVQELATVVERALLLCQEEWIDRQDFYLPYSAEERLQAVQDREKGQGQGFREQTKEESIKDILSEARKKRSTDRRVDRRSDSSAIDESTVIENQQGSKVRAKDLHKDRVIYELAEEAGEADLAEYVAGTEKKVIRGPGFTLLLEKETIFVEDIEKKLIEYVLERFEGDQNKSSRALGMTRASLASRMQKYQISHVGRRRRS
ncbi:sigma-54-dependent transcriptional regulator [Heliorestis acidaminivorans]|uniref:sigma-54-dependent transcriptional regulator n=1 Tax=Heliorestis acidaminivorans TaxID=553427 RepID=UPI00147821C4|nr:sigma-54 dependent transcriptional regulator [Heliorestis acidaminivorans]